MNALSWIEFGKANKEEKMDILLDEIDRLNKKVGYLMKKTEQTVIKGNICPVCSDTIVSNPRWLRGESYPYLYYCKNCEIELKDKRVRK